MSKRILSLTLAVLMALALVPAAFAADEPEIEAPLAPEMEMEEPVEEMPEAPALAEMPAVAEEPADEPVAAAALPPESVVQERLLAMYDQWPDGTHWDSKSYYVDKSGYKEYGCFGFAIMLQEAAFPGLYGPYRKNAPIRFEDICVGDMLSTPGHTAIVVERHEDYVVMAEGNMNMGVRWGRKVTAADMGELQYRWTYYPDSASRYKNGWYLEEDGWRYYKNDVVVKNAWVWDGAWYFVDENGEQAAGLREIITGAASDGWYYFNPKHDGTYGAMLTGWRWINDSYYYFNPKNDGACGRMARSQWVCDGKSWTYLDENGKMVTGLYWVLDGSADDGLYYFNPAHDGGCGHVMSGWQDIDGARYYFEPRHNGRFGQGYVAGTYVIDGVSRTFNAYGQLVG